MDRKWGAELDRSPPSAVALSAVEQELRSVGLHMLAFPEQLGGIGGEVGVVGAVLRTLGEVDACWAEWVLARTVAALPFAAEPRCMEERPLADGWSFTCENASVGGAKRSGRIWVYGWVPGCEVVRAAAFSEGAMQFEVAVAGESAQPQASLGLRRCGSVQLPLLEQGARLQVEVGREQVQEWLHCVELWRSGIVLANARSALREAWHYARSRQQGGARLVDHRTVQSLFAEPLAHLLAAEALWEQATSEKRLVPWVIVLAARVGEQACHAAQQILGGYGYMRDYRVEHRLRDAKTLALRLGDGRRRLQDVVRPNVDGDNVWL